MRLPTGEIVYKHTPIYNGSNFSWGEATHNCTRPISDLIIDGRLIIESGKIQQNIVATAKKLDRVRSLLGERPIWVNSWYRPSHVNARVGGAKYSRHQYGDAVDICSDYHSPRTIYRLLRDIHMGGMGCYYSFVHLDWRGQVARWSA